MIRTSLCILFSLMVLQIDPGDADDKRRLFIIGGNSSDIESHIYQVSVWANGGYRGSGAMVYGNWVVTTASIVSGFEASSLAVRFHSTSVSSGGHLLNVNKLVIHRKFHFCNMTYDVALLRLRTDRPLKKRCTLIGSWPEVVLARKPLDMNATATLSGWGSTTNITNMNDHLEEVDVRTVSPTMCKEPGRQELSRTQFCAQAIDAYGPCWGDGGDLLVHNGSLYGLLSYNRGCFYKAKPSVYTDISSVRRWIYRTVRPHKPKRFN